MAKEESSCYAQLLLSFGCDSLNSTELSSSDDEETTTLTSRVDLSKVDDDFSSQTVPTQSVRTNKRRRSDDAENSEEEPEHKRSNCDTKDSDSDNSDSDGNEQDDDTDDANHNEQPEKCQNQPISHFHSKFDRLLSASEIATQVSTSTTISAVNGLSLGSLHHWNGSVYSDVTALPSCYSTLADSQIKTHLSSQWALYRKKQPIADHTQDDFFSEIPRCPYMQFSPLQTALFPLVSSYMDLCYPVSTLTHRQYLKELYLLHVINHLLKTRANVLKNNTKLKENPDLHDSDAIRDQGFARAKVLILLPFKNSAFNVVKSLLKLLPSRHQEQILNHKRFLEEFSPDEEDKKDQNKPKDYNERFFGNTDDCFRFGLSFSGKSVKLYSDFYSSDIIIASPLALRMITGGDGDTNRDFDFLSSIEVLVIDECESLLMQNWTHLLTILQVINSLPVDARNADFSRIRQWYLEGWAKYYRQTLIFGEYLSPEMLQLFNKKCCNFSGKVRLRQTYTGSICTVVPTLKQVFLRVKCNSLKESFDARFEFFTQQLLPQISAVSAAHTMIFVPSYFDYVRVRNYLKQNKLSFCACCEYSKGKEISRSRTTFFSGQKEILLLTERFHFFRRYRIRGMQHIVFYQLPSNCNFFSELLNMLTGNAMTCTSLFSGYDALVLERVIGSNRAARLLASEKSVHVIA